MSWLIASLSHLPGMLTCRELESFMVDYLDGKLRWREALPFRLHVFFCPVCRAYIQAYDRARKLAKGVLPLCKDDGTAADVPPELVEAIMRRRGAPPA